MTNTNHRNRKSLFTSLLAAGVLAGGLLPLSLTLAAAEPSAKGTPAQAKAANSKRAPRTPNAPPHCSLDAPLLYSHDTASLQAPGTSLRHLELRSSGAWVLDEDGAEQRGCLSASELSSLTSALRRADFRKQPTPAFQCRALPTQIVTVFDASRKRRAQYRTPCGEPVHASLSALMNKVETTLAAHDGQPSQPVILPVPKPQPTPSQPVILPMPKPSQPATCTAEGTPIYTESQRVDGARSATSLAVYSNGAWTYQTGAERQGGCLSKKQVNALTRRMQRARFQVNQAKGPRCMALVAEHHRISTRYGRLAWDGPCGQQVPHRSVSQLQKLVRRMLKL
ncbi:hypothetical protein [Haliangium ochraceum]|uniref:Uncharacterized protein n=1 Tax=Haliangium ochraceum (strain DSM 14365 / JCM 11303 / SMP-2) TaxID=502025 RepID=D0LYH2_HALO1|nr:hypothetical protein [Haliangium ochraceum]ACY17838.1 hypothetical protein Hoch_5354 [Haliangium ochraceum DSM 14365]